MDADKKKGLELQINEMITSRYKFINYNGLRNSHLKDMTFTSKIVMNDEELDSLIISHYENEAQTLTSAAESSLLRFKEIFGSITPEEQERWKVIKETFVKNNKNKGGSNNVQFIIDEMQGIAKSLKGIDHTISGRTSG